LFNFVSKRKWFFLISALVIVPGIISLIVSGLNLGIEFSSGSTMTLVFKEPVSQADLRDALTGLDHSEAVIQHSTKDVFLLEGQVLTSEEKLGLIDALEPEFGSLRVADFSSETEGSLALMFEGTVSESDLREQLDIQGYTEAGIQGKTIDSFLIRTRTLVTEQRGSEGNIVTPAEESTMKQALNDEFGPLASLDFYSISPIIASERVLYTGIAMGVAALGILLYITWAFRKLVHSPRYGFAAIIALIHDALIVLGIFSLFKIEIDSIFIIAVLTVIGYSVNNTIVVFDRIRENRPRHVNRDFESVVNISLTETLGRSINTSLTTLFALLAIYLFGGATISNFALALIIGIIAGTYSSIFVAGNVVVSWDRGELGRLFRWIPLRRRATRSKS